MALETNGMFFGWGRAVPGREHAASELFGQALAYYDKLVKNGKLASYEPVFLQPHGGDLNGFFYFKGTSANLEWMRTDDEFVDIITRAGHCMNGVGIIPCWVGKELKDVMARWTKTVPR